MEKVKISKLDLYIILLGVICIVLLILLWKTQANLSYMLELYKSECYIAPKSQALEVFFNGSI